MRYFITFTAITITIIIISGCAISPVTGKREIMLFSDSQEIELGKNADPDIQWQFGGPYNDPELSAYVNSVGQRTAAVSHRADIPYHFTVVDSSIANAFALPGGYIYITRGLLVLMDNEAQLASVLGHEIGHVTARHGVKRLQSILGFNIVLAIVDQATAGSNKNALIKTASSVMFSTVSLGYSRKDEYQADELGAEYAAKAGYNPEGMIQLLSILKNMHEREPSSVEEFFMSHPASSKRIEEVNKQMNNMPVNNGNLNESQYRAKISKLKTAQKAYDHYDKGEEYRSKGQYQQALNEYQKALKIKDMAKPHHGIGVVYHTQGKRDQAIREYKKAVQLYSKYIFAYNDMGKAYIEKSQYDLAVPQLKQAVQIYANFSDAHSNLGEAYYNLKQYTEAIKSLEIAVAINENHPRAHTTLGLSYEATGNLEKAIAEYEKAIQIAPDESYTNTAKQRLSQIKKEGI